MEQSPRRPVEVAKPKPMTNLQVVKRIALQNNVTMHVVRLALDTISSKTKEELITKGKSRLWAFVPFVSMKIVEKPPIMVYQKRYRNGRIDTIKARPRRKKVKAYVHPNFQILLAYGKGDVTSCCSVAVPTQLRRGCLAAGGSNALSRRFFID